MLARQHRDRQRLAWLRIAIIGVALLTGCATYHVVPTGNQTLAQANVGSVLLTVPRLDSSSYPGDVLDISTPVMVVIENRGNTDIAVDPDQFELGAPGAVQLRSVAPQRLVQSGGRVTWSLPRGTLLASLSNGVFGGEPPPRVLTLRGSWLAAHVPVVTTAGRGVYVAPPGARVPVPGWRGGYYVPRSYPYARSRWGFWLGGPLYWGPEWWAGWYGNPWFWPWFFDGPRYYGWSRVDAVRLALPAGRLPAGGRTGGFVYFPYIERSQGLPLTLTWTIREANEQRILGTAQVSLEMRAD